MGNIKDCQDHEHTISEESREEMDMEKPWRKHLRNRLHFDWLPSMVTDVTVIK